METQADRATTTSRQRTLVWIDPQQAVIVRWDGAAKFIRIESDVPAHRRGIDQEAGGQYRLEHLHRFISQVEARLGPGDELEILGPGTLRERLAHLVETNDRQRGRLRHVCSYPTGPLTDAQLVALVREAAEPPRPDREGAPGCS